MTLVRQNPARIVTHESYEGRGFTDHNALARMRLTQPDTLDPTITYLMGREDKRFPLTFLTEGQKGGKRSIGVNDIEYKFPVMGRLKQSDALVRVETVDPSTDTDIGQGGTPVYMVFKTNWMKLHHTIYSPNGVACRIQSKGERVNGGFRYETVLIYRDDSESIPGSELLSNVKWSMTGGAAVPASDSMGNESNVQAPGELKNQISILRKSYRIAGNVANKVVEFMLPKKGGGTTSYWMPFEEYQHDIQFKQACEEHLWWSRYNRTTDGVITTIDKDTGLPIPMGAGVDDQIPNKDTYGELTAKKLARTVSDVMYGATDTGAMNIVLFTGIGGMEEFDNAIKRDIQGNASSVWSVVGSGTTDKFVTGSPGSRNLSFGAYFTQYQHVDGHTVTVKHLNLLDYGGRADNSPEHPITGKPLSSYEMYFLDMSQYDGKNNIQMVHEKGRMMIRGVEQGMSLLKGSNYGDYKGNDISLNLATEQDRSSVHYLKTLGISMYRNTHCFKLSCDLS